MLSRILLAFALSPMLVTSAFAQTCGSNNLVSNPVPFNWQPGSTYETGTLVMDKAELTINGESLITRVYAQEGQPLSIPGPTLEMEAGKKYVMRFNNLLPHQPLTLEHNTFTDPNVTNVHTHGLHISGGITGRRCHAILRGPARRRLCL